MTAQNPPDTIEQASDTDAVARMRIIPISRASHTELQITAVPAAGASAEAVFDAVAAILRERGASVVSQEVFGCGEGDYPERALASAVGERTWPVTWLGGAVGREVPFGGTQLWAVSGIPVEPVRLEGEIVGTAFEDEFARYCRLGGLLPPEGGASRPEQAAAVFERMASALDSVGMAFRHVLRTWFYNNDILAWYGDFNKVRDAFFTKHRVFDGLVPASTGMGGCNAAGRALVSGLLAADPKSSAVCAEAVPSPLQCPALEYGSAFSRAVELCTADLRRLLVSGTASIDPDGHTVHVGDTPAQVAQTMRVVAAILESRGMEWEDVCRAVAYVKHRDDIGAFHAYCAQEKLTGLPVVVMNDDICRDDLLFEIEVDAVRPA
ncbi:MAG: hypothetical protein JXR94_14980 [Candidatus Hydrogenedentes bacterium]|nr:hypothetical protein [Candidatus Hydrogenedentota bacterium]